MTTNQAIKEIKFASIEAGIKYENRKDLMLVVFDNPVICSGVFSTSSIVSATLDWDRKILKKDKKIKALIVNSGNANSFTGKYGLLAINKTCESLAQELDCELEEILVSSTGVIGEKLPYDKIATKIPELLTSLNEDGLVDAAKAIMTTDTVEKLIYKKINILGEEVTIAAIAKGAGMMAPNMATTLAYFFTDAKITKNSLDKVFKDAIDKSFNLCTIDGDMSTNDTALIFSTGLAKNELIAEDSESYDIFAQELENIMLQICDELILDGEGVTKMAKIHISGAENKKAAKNIAMSIANSPLVKTALNGSDPNWGRIVMAVGKSKEKVNLENFSLAIGEFNIVTNGELNEDYNEESSTAIYMKKQKIDIFVNVGITPEKNQITATTSDLSKGYVEINADYRS